MALGRGVRKRLTDRFLMVVAAYFEALRFTQ